PGVTAMRCAMRPLAHLLARAVPLIAVVAACAPAPPPAAAPVGATSGAVAQLAPASGATNGPFTGPSEWVVGLAEEPASLDPGSGAAVAASSQAQLYLFDPLVSYETQSFKLVPMLAQAWTVADDRVWDFKLRRGVKFHNGDDLTAADVKYSFDVYKGERSPRQ